jgi:signal transduction histidine kinase/ActR/RegA family two-component response regulator
MSQPKGAVHPPFQARVASVAIVTTIVVLLTACISFMLQQWVVAQQDARHGYTTLAQVVATASADDLARGDRAEAARTVSAAAATHNVSELRLIDANGRLLADVRVPVNRHARGALETFREPVRMNGRRLGEVVIVAAPAPLAALLPRFFALTGALFFGTCGIALFIAWGLARRVTRPIERLAQAMAGVAASGDFTAVAEEADDDVFHRLTQSFNDLLRQLDANNRELHQTMGELVEARDAANAANVAKSQFLANMSHEIRTPLNGVLAMAEVMSRGDLSAAQQERVQIIRQSGGQLLAVLNDVLDLSKIEAGKLDLAAYDFDLDTVVQPVREAFGVVAQEKGLDFSVDIDAEAMGAWRGDGDRLRQILSNLVSNAVKFTAAGKVHATFTAAYAGGLRLAVSDTGIGIPADKMAGLFEKFTQADSSMTRQYGGTGLGLAICRELVNLMDGRIWVDSVEGEGSTFYIELPFARAESAVTSAEPVADAEVDGRSVHLLAAEDNPVNQKVLQAVVEPMGVELTIVGDGAQAVEAWRTGEFDAILMDIQMPVMDGISAAKAIRAAERSDGRVRTPILALTANALTHQVEEYIAAGMDGHVAKPIEIGKLYDALSRVLAGGEAEAETEAA